LESDCLLPSDCRDHAPSLSRSICWTSQKQTEEDEFGIREPSLYFLNEGGDRPFSIRGLCRLGASGRLLRPDCRLRNKPNSPGAFAGTVKTNRGQAIPTCNRELAIHGSVDSGNLFVGSGTPASLNAGSGTIEDVGMTPNFA
jgi:hypothetical protein